MHQNSDGSNGTSTSTSKGIAQAMAVPVPAAARDTTRLEPLVFFIYLLY